MERRDCVGALLALFCGIAVPREREAVRLVNGVWRGVIMYDFQTHAYWEVVVTSCDPVTGTCGGVRGKRVILGPAGFAP